MAHLFFAIPLPPAVCSQLQQLVTSEAFAIQTMQPVANWHISLLSLATDELPVEKQEKILVSMPQPFFPVANLTHIGLGKTPGQLWAYVRPSAALGQLRLHLEERLKELGVEPETNYNFLPHIYLADTSEPNSMAVDHALPLTVPIKSIQLLEKEGEAGKSRYTVRGNISLSD